MSKESIYELLKKVYPLSLRMELFNAIWSNLIKESQVLENALVLAVEELEDAEKCAIDFQNQNTELENDIAELKSENLNIFEYSQKIEQRLVEKDARIEELEGQVAYECECNKQFVECQKENEELKQQLKKFLESNNELLKQIMELEAQLIKERLKGEKE